MAISYGLLYTAKGTASLLVPLGNVLQAATGSWMPIFVLAIAFDWIGAGLALFVLKPLRIRWVAAQLGARSPARGGAAVNRAGRARKWAGHKSSGL